MGSSIKGIFQEGITDVYSKAITATNESPTKDYIQDTKGSVRFDELGNGYRFVINDEGSTDTEVGFPVCYDISNVGADLLKSVVLPVTNDLFVFAGVCISVIPFGGAGWIQISGYNADCDVDEPGTTAIAIGATLTPLNSLNFLGDTAAVTAAATAPIYPGYVQALEAVATATPTTATTTNIQVIVHATPAL